MLIILIRTLISHIKARKILINQGFPIKNKHRFYDTVSYHNYGAYLVRETGLEPRLCKPHAPQAVRSRKLRLLDELLRNVGLPTLR